MTRNDEGKEENLNSGEGAVATTAATSVFQPMVQRSQSVEISAVQELVKSMSVSPVLEHDIRCSQLKNKDPEEVVSAIYKCLACEFEPL